MFFDILPKQWIASIIIGGLLAGNGFFVKRLVDEVDATRAQVTQLHEQVTVLDVKLEYYSRQKSIKESE